MQSSTSFFLFALFTLLSLTSATSVLSSSSVPSVRVFPTGTYSLVFLIEAVNLPTGPYNTSNPFIANLTQDIANNIAMEQSVNISSVINSIAITNINSTAVSYTLGGRRLLTAFQNYTVAFVITPSTVGAYSFSIASAANTLASTIAAGTFNVTYTTGVIVPAQVTPATANVGAAPYYTSTYTSAAAPAFPTNTISVAFLIQINNPPAGPYNTSSPFVANLTLDIATNIAAEQGITNITALLPFIVITSLNGTTVSYTLTTSSRRLLTTPSTPASNYSIIFAIVPPSSSSGVVINTQTAANAFAVAASTGTVTLATTPGATVPVQALPVITNVGTVASTGVGVPAGAPSTSSAVLAGAALIASLALLL